LIILNFILFSFAILLLLIFLGIGIAILVLPHDKLKYSLFFAPFFGLSYGTFIGWIFFVNSIGTDRYVYATLIIPFIALIVGIYLRKKDINEVFRPFHKKNLILLGICACLFLFISLPYSTLPEFSTITLGNNDIIDYAFVSKFLMQPDFHSAPQVVFERNNYMLTNQYFSAYFVGSYSASLFGVEAYSLENILNYLFFILILPFIYLIAHEIFRCKNKVALLITFLVGLNFNLIFITYQGFLGQLIGTGFFLGISFLMLDGMENRPLFSQTKLYPALAIMVYGLVMSYCTLVPIIFIPFFV